MAELARDAHRELPGTPGTFRIQPGIGALTSLGAATVDVTWADDSWQANGAATAFYYVRVFQIDGEMAWSSPIWVQPAGS
jgi:hypothetical protein